MCGIAGFFDIGRRQSRAAIQAAGQAMTSAIVSRGPDDHGSWQDPDLPLFLGHRRLSIIDLSVDGHQPMASASGRFVIVYNGEVYNFRTLGRELAALGAKFRGRSDTEVMLAAIEQWGLDRALQKLNGMFAFALWDRQARVLHLVRDRMGKKPLYVGWAGKTLLFGSELKALRAHPDFIPAVNREALALYMRYSCVPAPYSIYRGVWQLLSGCRMALDLNTLDPGADLSVRAEPYWHHPRVVEEARARRRDPGDKEAIDEFESLLGEAVRSRMISDVPLGAFLSGGIDSSAVVALMRQHAGKPVKTFAVGFAESGFNEADHAAKVAAHLGTDHHTQICTPHDALDVIPTLPDVYDEPFADVSQIPTYLVARFARKKVTVALSGDGGDELFGGYLRHFVVPAIWRHVGRLPLPVRGAMARGITMVGADRWSRLVPQHPQFGERLYKVAELLPQESLEAAYRHLTSSWTAPASLVRGGAEPLVPLLDERWQPKGLSFAERMMCGDALSYLPNDILVKVDRASMAVSLEARSPLLDQRLFEYSWSLPLRMKIRDKQGKWILRQVLARHMPRDLFERPKQGFTLPVGHWLRGPLKDWAAALLDEQRLEEEGYFDAAPVRAAWEEHLSGRGRHAHRLWTVLMFQGWLDKWGRGSACHHNST